MWLALIVLMIGVWNAADASVSIAIRFPGDEMTGKEKFELGGRIVRGVFGLILVLTAFFLVQG